MKIDSRRLLCHYFPADTRASLKLARRIPDLQELLRFTT
ncbi:hypothetical protein POX_c04572 [Penicillium oxalicum]|nr:hypothetical protein POX_c04572 [Penicillium oxalicum]KAI2791701.1 hypothetical protein POX_c04572 [Penicillium oxalicum]